MNVVVTGSLGFDYIMDFSGRFADRIMPENIHKISLAPLVDTLNKQFGGTAGNIAYSLKLLGMVPLIQSCGGNDFAPYQKFLTSHKISTRYITIQKNVLTGTYFVVTDKDDSQIGAFYKGALADNKKLSLRTVKDVYDFVVISPNETKAMTQYVAACATLGKRYMYDPAFQISDFTPEQLRAGIENAAVVIGNDYEIDLMLQKLEITREELIVITPIVITTLGAKGSIIETRKESIHIKPAKVKNISDPTGAGDAFRAGFIAGYLRKYDLQICGQMGSVAAAYTVETYGTQTHTFTKKDFIKRYKENFGEGIKLS